MTVSQLVCGLKQYIDACENKDQLFALKCDLIDTLDDHFCRRHEIIIAKDRSGDDLVTDQQLALMADRRADAKWINGGGA